MNDPAVVCKSCEVVEHFPAVFTLVYFVPAVCMDVRTEIISTSVAPATDVAGKWLLSGVDPHVSPEVCCSDKLPSTDVAWEGSLWLQLLTFLLSQVVCLQCHHLAVHHLTWRRNSFDCIISHTLTKKPSKGFTVEVPFES